MDPKSSSKKVGIGIAVVAIVAVITIYFAYQQSSNQMTSNSDTTVANSNTPSDVSTSSDNTSGGNQNASTSSQASDVNPADTSKNSISSYAYKNGTYTAVGSYMSPGGQDKIGVTLTIKNDIVASSSIKQMPGDNTSARFQNIFAAGYQSQVVGQDISNLSVGKVSRSSLTPEGFNDALDKIRAQAKA